MNPAHVHLVLNHIPIIGAISGIILLSVAIYRKDLLLSRLSLLWFTGVGLFTLVVFLTGEPAEEIVEGMAGVSGEWLERHEDAGKITMISMSVLFVLSLVTFFLSRVPEKENLTKKLTLLVLLVGFAVTGLAGWTSSLGAKINHPEIRYDGSFVAPSAEHDDDD